MKLSATPWWKAAVTKKAIRSVFTTSETRSRSKIFRLILQSFELLKITAKIFHSSFSSTILTPWHNYVIYLLLNLRLAKAKKGRILSTDLLWIFLGLSSELFGLFQIMFCWGSRGVAKHFSIVKPGILFGDRWEGEEGKGVKKGGGWRGGGVFAQNVLNLHFLAYNNICGVWNNETFQLNFSQTTDKRFHFGKQTSFNCKSFSLLT